MVLCMEKFAARDVQEAEETKTATAIWNIFGAADEVTARAALIAALPGSYTFPSGVIGYVSNLQLRDVFESGNEKDLTHEATVTYSARVPKVEDYVEYEFDTTGSENYTQTHALSTTAVTAGGRIAPNFFGAINPKSDGTIAGIQAESNIFQFSLTKHWARASVTTAYQVLLSQFTKKINDAPFGPAANPIPIGCCRFLGARGKPAGDKWPIEYRFEVRWPETVTIRDMTVTKEGYQHLSVYRVKFSDTTSRRTIEIPWCVYVQNVIDKVDFSLLNVTW